MSACIIVQHLIYDRSTLDLNAKGGANTIYLPIDYNLNENETS
jgi:hypothetical protein